VRAERGVGFALTRAAYDGAELEARAHREHARRRPPHGQQRVTRERVEEGGEVGARRGSVDGAERVECGGAREEGVAGHDVGLVDEAG